jgi:hypothetical protein
MIDALNSYEFETRTAGLMYYYYNVDLPPLSCDSVNEEKRRLSGIHAILRGIYAIDYLLKKI